MIGLAAVCPQVASVECARGRVVEGVLECTAAVPTCANAPVRYELRYPSYRCRRDLANGLTNGRKRPCCERAGTKLGVLCGFRHSVADYFDVDVHPPVFVTSPRFSFPPPTRAQTCSPPAALAQHL